MDEKEQLDSAVYLTKAEFSKFEDNDFFHLVQTVKEIGKDVFFVKGILTVITPLILAMLGVILAVVMRG